VNYFDNLYAIFAASAPWLLLGLLIAGIMNRFMSTELLTRHLGDNHWLSIIKAAFIGAPLPLCSCGVIPAALGLRRAGASKPATVSFLVATPETGVDSISISYALLGPFFAILRPIAAILSAIYAGFVTLWFAVSRSKSVAETANSCNEGGASSAKPSAVTAEQKSCCASKSKSEAPLEKVTTAKKCCAGQSSGEAPAAQQPFLQRLGAVLSFATGKLLNDIAGWLLLGLALAAAIKTWVPNEWLVQWGSGWQAMVVMALVGLPMYICATASTPIAAGFLAAGLSPGAILVFMLAGPATNLSTMGMIRQEMGTSVLVAYLFAVISASIALGVLTNHLVALWQIEIPLRVAELSAHQLSVIEHLSAVLLALLMLRNAWQKRLKSFATSTK